MPPASVHCVVTSPPYYGLRDYGLDRWEGGDPACDHKHRTAHQKQGKTSQRRGRALVDGPLQGARGTNVPQTKNPNVTYPTSAHRGGDPSLCDMCGARRVSPTVWTAPDMEGCPHPCDHEWGDPGTSGQRCRNGRGGTLEGGNGPEMLHPPTGTTCVRCGAWRGSLGLEPSPELYVAHLVQVFREVRRVLRPDGTVWLNLGDSYFGTGRGPSDDPERSSRPRGLHEGVVGAAGFPTVGHYRHPVLKQKDLIGVPWRVAFALQADDWYLRSDVIWSKHNPMPESVEDRPTKSHEYLFLLAASERYFYDRHAVTEPAVHAGRVVEYDGTQKSCRAGDDVNDRRTTIARTVSVAARRNKRSVWVVNTRPFPQAHFAVFPPDLVEPCVLASTSARGACSECGAPWERVVEATGETAAKKQARVGGSEYVNAQPRKAQGLDFRGDHATIVRAVATTGWRPTCDHGGAPTIPCTVLDPFGGSGTVAVVAVRNGRDAVLVDASAEYAEMSRRRLAAEDPLFTAVTVDRVDAAGTTLEGEVVGRPV